MAWTYDRMSSEEESLQFELANRHNAIKNQFVSSKFSNRKVMVVARDKVLLAEIPYERCKISGCLNLWIGALSYCLDLFQAC